MMMQPSPQERRRIEASKAPKRKRRDDAAAREAVISRSNCGLDAVVLAALHTVANTRNGVAKTYTPNGRMEKN
jgi:hypothetical protein